PHLLLSLIALLYLPFSLFFLFNAPPPPEIYTLSLHDALPISTELRSRYEIPLLTANGGSAAYRVCPSALAVWTPGTPPAAPTPGDRKSTRLNSSHSQISYAVFCLKKKKKK